MKIFELKRLKRTMGAITFGLFFSNENKRLEQKQGIGKQSDLVLVFVPEGKQTVTVKALREVMNWTVKKATAFVKEGDYPKVVDYNIDMSLKTPYIDAVKKYQYELKKEGVILEIY